LGGLTDNNNENANLLIIGYQCFVLQVSQVNIKKIWRDSNKFFAASSGVGTARKKNLYQSREFMLCISFI